MLVSSPDLKSLPKSSSPSDDPTMSGLSLGDDSKTSPRELSNAVPDIRRPNTSGADSETSVPGFIQTRPPVPAIADEKQDSANVAKDSIREAAEASVAATQGDRPQAVTYHRDDERWVNTGRSRVPGPSECDGTGCFRGERKRLLGHKTRSPYGPADAAAILRRQRMSGSRSHKARTRTIRLVAAVVLLFFIMNYCVGSRRPASQVPSPVLSRFLKANSVNMDRVQGDKTVVDGMVSSRRLADKESSPDTRWPDENTEDVCDSTIRALASHVVTEAQNENAPRHQPQRDGRPASMLEGLLIAPSHDPLSEDDSLSSFRTSRPSDKTAPARDRRRYKRPRFQEVLDLTLELVESLPPDVYAARMPDWTKYQSDCISNRFVDYLRGTVSVLGESLERFRVTAVRYQEGDRSDSSAISRFREVAGDLLSTVLSGHLLMCRIHLFFPWRKPYFYTSGRPSVMTRATGSLAEALYESWSSLGIYGEARRQILERLIVKAGNQTLQDREAVFDEVEHRSKVWIYSASTLQTTGVLKETQILSSAALEIPVMHLVEKWLKDRSLSQRGISLTGQVAKVLRLSGIQVDGSGASWREEASSFKAVPHSDHEGSGSAMARPSPVEASATETPALHMPPDEREMAAIVPAESGRTSFAPLEYPAPNGPQTSLPEQPGEDLRFSGAEGDGSSAAWFEGLSLFSPGPEFDDEGSGSEAAHPFSVGEDKGEENKQT
ncbi:hypothetical protein CSUI_005354 [Cystoisospora suis]|uniref:Uncharacterized protein n=1 Tax=Cystoisospora suis TaxID=483139 RepID=A0A2C6KXV2_9APIC|nr:hypothetical protein CSUI_005354 [Cystoisospora suis]